MSIIMYSHYIEWAFSQAYSYDMYIHEPMYNVYNYANVEN